MTAMVPVPAARLPMASRAPGKCIIFGEHAVVHGGPELLLAIDLFTQVALAPAPVASLNGDPEASRTNPYFARAVAELPAPGSTVAVRSVSRIPRSSTA